MNRRYVSLGIGAALILMSVVGSRSYVIERRFTHFAVDTIEREIQSILRWEHRLDGNMRDAWDLLPGGGQDKWVFDVPSSIHDTSTVDQTDPIKSI